MMQKRREDVLLNISEPVQAAFDSTMRLHKEMLKTFSDRFAVNEPKIINNFKDCNMIPVLKSVRPQIPLSVQFLPFPCFKSLRFICSA